MAAILTGGGIVAVHEVKATLGQCTVGPSTNPLHQPGVLFEVLKNDYVLFIGRLILIRRSVQRIPHPMRWEPDRQHLPAHQLNFTLIAVFPG